MKRFATILLALVMLLSLTIGVAAQEVDSDKNGSATITITNASKGETYAVYKLFDATVTGTKDGSIAYTGEIPDALKDYFTVDSVGNISLAEGVDETALFAALKAWADSEDTTATAEAVSDGSELTFKNLEYGYYVVTTTQGDAAITVTSTNPNATIVDKNSTTPAVDLKKETADGDVSIGDTVTYVVTFSAANFDGEGTTAKQIVEYIITDTLPEFLDSVNVTSITIDNDPESETDEVINVTEQFVDGKITLKWVDDQGNNIYDNGAVVTITYTATVTDKITIDGAGNKNEVEVSWKTENDEGGSTTQKNEEIIFTYATALQKVDENSAPLAGAKFAANGLIVTGSAGNYTVVSYDPDSEELGNVMETDDQGNLVIKGLAKDVTLTVTETEAPAGYNKLVDTFELTPVVTGETVTVTTTTVYYDEDGEVTNEETENSKVVTTYPEKLTAKKIENKKGSVLPSTGGMGTTMFYLFGGILVLAAVVLLVTKKRMTNVE